ncbi:hypothetical protein CWB99_17190 [Pseudoalteromonas rubra]|uniref:Solute-binding protein family 3/N-terminal domain-containing protein n=1 Tax=Pseudoalteromonas rubra TaxID=43658 RepID=A0A5S3WIZ8_9GAMM|nr:hypothetical protein [Pseudoalteromonas rubra]TMP26832.1 hypothetical protein CWB99_17190 [Pseudoalteromonas rubra]TMP33783.1 hypothetical protein CWC00_09755 [Pseudoalteromonas rubra]
MLKEMFLLITRVIVLCAISAPICATPLTISYLQHPSVRDQALPLVQAAYAQAGIKANFIAMPAHRVLHEITAEHTDGDVILAQEIFAPFKDVISVGPALTEVDFVLLCVANVPCDNSVLVATPSTIVATDQSKRVLLTKYPQAQRNQFYQINNLGKLPELLNLHRFDYAVFVVSTQWPLPDSLAHLNVHHLFSSKAYHVLHKKHASMAAQLSLAIATVKAQKGL